MSSRTVHRRILPLLIGALLALGGLPGVASASTTGWQPKTPPLTTPWTAQVGPDNALPEYPRPQLTRPDWQNLNGVWRFAAATAGQAPPIGQPLAESVLVPYPIESALSGIQRHHDRMWYQRDFTVPAEWSGRRIQLNFGAVDWRAEVWVNGVRVGGHTGGYTRFSFDITDAVRPGGNELLVGVHDPTDAGGQPLGKQRLNPSDIFYTAASGIWQTVWLEPTAAAHVTRLDVTPDVPGSAVGVTVRTAGAAGKTVRVTARDGGTVVATGTGAPDTELRLNVPNPRLWSPDNPFLYDLEATVEDGTGVLDRVGGYFGMRSIGKAQVNGVLRPVLNGQFVFQAGTLDQGYWPDGVYTAPTDEALKFDLQAHKDLGFNTVRKHAKVEPDRWYYWADKLGLLVWQDMPSMARPPANAEADAGFKAELRALIDQLRGVTSIVQWVPFNEGWGAYQVGDITNQVKAWDPTRLVDNNSGVNCCGEVDAGNGDVVDDHIYVGPDDLDDPDAPHQATATRVAALGEYGGLGLAVPGHVWKPGVEYSYEKVRSAEALTNRYVHMQAEIQRLIPANGLSSAIYTQLTDVETEVNGLYTYDRRVLKPDAARLRKANRALLAGTPVAESVPLTLNAPISLQVTTPGHTEKFARHYDSLGYTEKVTAASDETLRKDATWIVRRGLANAACYSFESVNFPGEYLRHRDFRVRKEYKLSTEPRYQYLEDATWCARPGLGGAGVSFEANNKPGRFLRHYASELWLAASGGPGSYNAKAFYADDVTWRIAPPWYRP
ncbi:AbfB domain-containing protein [Amycolatopsis anabasis]|uniref:AbfB domain-containing protein n=1 Tax=Amycolatopsis anabasis TaxID=1840409 RepID=UPI00131B775E|nr:AbfB domain-containing protein [Amycolatopsis anabasis]